MASTSMSSPRGALAYFRQIEAGHPSMAAATRAGDHVLMRASAGRPQGAAKPSVPPRISVEAYLDSLMAYRRLMSPAAAIPSPQTLPSLPRSLP